MPADRRLRVVVTGATAGLGYYAAERIASLGHQVVIAARSPERAVRAAREGLAESLCTHGDSPGAVEMARAVRGALIDAGLQLRPFFGDRP